MRTRNQRLEEESITKFKGLVPSDWLVREKPNDYGIDLEVEVFDGDDSTGLVFWVQMKGTDSKERRKIESIQFARKKLQQFRSYPINVMIVRYSSVRNEFYYIWSNKYLFLEGSTTTDNITVKFNPSDVLSPDSKESIEEFLRVNELVKSNRFRFPIKTIILGQKGNITSKVLGLKKKLQGETRHLALTNDKHKSALVITLYKDRLVFDLSNLVGASLGIGKVEEITKPVQAVHLGLTLLLAQANRLDDMNEIIDEYDLWDAMISNQELLIYLLQYLLDGSKMEDNVKFIIKCIENDQDLILEGMSSAILLIARSSKDPKKQAVIEFFLNEMIRITGKQSKTRLATQLYNYANYCRGRGLPEKAFSYYNQARKNHPLYCEKEYFLTEMASVLFESSRFKMSRKLYEKSVSLDNENLHNYFLYADSLIYEGKYRKSLEVLSVYLKKQTKTDSSTFSEATLKYQAINFILKNEAPDNQKRETLKAIGKSPAFETKSVDENIESISEALELDSLCTLAWFNLGYAYSLKEDTNRSFACYLMAALFNRHDLSAWLNASWFSTINKESMGLFPHIIRAAYFYCGDDFLFNVLEKLEELKQKEDQKTESNIQPLIDAIMSISKLGKEETSVIRVFDENDEIVIEAFSDND